MADQREVAIQRLTRATANLNDAKRQYEEAVVNCVDVGIGNSKIAQIVGVTETAIRTWLKRHGHERESTVLRRQARERYGRA